MAWIHTNRRSALPLSVLTAAALGLAGVGSASAQAQPPAPANVVALSATASTEVVNDWLTLVLSTTREGPEAQAVQAQLRQALDAALSEARKAASPGQVEVQTGQFTLSPRYAPPTHRNGAITPGGIAAWQGSAELVVQGRDLQTITQLAGKIRTLTVQRVGFSLSREARDRVETELTTQAIARFGERADAITRAFGMRSWSLREVSVSGDDAPRPVMQPMMRASAAPMAMADTALPVEAGNALVSINVSGTVQLAK